MMKRARLQILSALLLAAASSGAWAAHFHHGARVGVFIGPSFGWYYPPPYYYPYPPVVVAPAAPPVYIEQGPAPEAPPVQPAPPPNAWYYCSNPDGYYPYVKQCPGGWQRVAPHPPS